MHYLEIIEVAANYLSYLNFDLFSRMSTRKSLDAQHQGFFYALCSFWSEPVFSKTRNTQKSPLKFSSKGFL